MRSIAYVAVAVLSFAGSAARAAGVDYVRSVKPILAERCYTCHGALKQKEGLRLDTVGLMKKGGKGGPAVVPGDPGKSLLIEHVTERGDASRMPPESEGAPLKPAEIEALRAWIAAGAVGPADERPEVDPREHWAFKAPVRPVVVGEGNPIDILLAKEWSRHGLTPQPEAPRGLLLRRVYLDLIGLPPTEQEQAEFLADQSPGAYERVIDRLLASPQYGERWGRHWMDVWRYSDWWGLGPDVRNSHKHIWHWRDWIVESLNADKGYDQMVREMLAADELYPTDENRLRATGYLARQYFKFNRNTWMEETVEHTAKAFLGLTLNCAKCHDHKFDPVTQEDFYKFRAFFEPYQLRLDVLGGETDPEKGGLARAFDCNLDAPTYLFTRGDERQPRKDRVIPPGVPGILSFGELKIAPVKLPTEAQMPGLRADVVAAYAKAAEARAAAAKTAVTQARKVAATRPTEFGPSTAKQMVEMLALPRAERALATAEAQVESVTARAAADRARDGLTNAKDAARAAVLAERRAAIAAADEAVVLAEIEVAKSPAAKAGEAVKKLAAAREALAKAQKGLDAPGEAYTSIRGATKTPESNIETAESQNKPFPATSSGRRSALAAWITDARNPLAARVAVNHIWARHFGRPLVATVFDFGRKVAAPTHPELLDYLAVEFRESGWSMKRLHRLIVTSRAYRMTSSAAGAAVANLAEDHDNRFLWRMNPVRMEAQVVRDSLLHLAGELDLTMGGPSIPVADESSRRRSLYFVHSNIDRLKFLSAFDDASVLECYRRAESIVPQQALALENTKLVATSASKIARRVSRDGDDDPAFVRALFLRVLGSPPTADERATCERALAELREIAIREKKADAPARARANLVHALLNHNDFVTIR